MVSQLGEDVINPSDVSITLMEFPFVSETQFFVFFLIFLVVNSHALNERG